MFAAAGTRIDIAYAANKPSLYSLDPKKIHMQAAKHVLQYLNGSTRRGVIYSPVEGLYGYADTAYANTRGMRSTTGQFFQLAGGPIT